ncbi:MAG: hypothetical protein C4521_10870 [Actinobacteria bacterium]|nr:MAG: hypothetical protein C4521_10870 [Actinomycetota bacterium]
MNWATPEGKELRRKLRDRVNIDGVSYAEAGREYNLTSEQVRKALRRYAEEDSTPPPIDRGPNDCWLNAFPNEKRVQHGSVVYANLRVPDPEAIETYRRAMLQLQAADEVLETRQVEVTIELPGSLPVGFAYTGDWHTGGKGVYYELSEADWDLIMVTEGLYAFGMGDYGDDYITRSHPGGQFGQIIQPSRQYQIVRARMGNAPRGKVLGLACGCHDHWVFREVSEDVVAELCKLADCANLWHGATVTVKVGRETYTFHIRHKFPFESRFNTTNAQRRMMEFFGPADWAVLGHLHYPEVDTRPLAGERRSLIRSGSYKVWDDYGQQLAGFKGKPGVPVVIVWPDKHWHVAFDDLRTGVLHLQAVRAAYEAGKTVHAA